MENKVEAIQKENKIQAFFIKTLNGMAYGLFATLIIGTIFGALSNLFALKSDWKVFEFLTSILNSKNGLAYLLQCITGAGIGIGIALSLKKDTLGVISLAAVGQLSAYFSLTTKFVTDSLVLNKFQIGDPLTIYLVVIATALISELVLKKKTPVDILLVPLFTISVGLILSLLIRYPAIYITYAVQEVIGSATSTVPFLMGIIVAVLMGMALTAPISSAAIAAMVFIPNSSNIGLEIASGAAIVGCCTQMIGFAVQSRKDNPIGLIISVGIGTSMLQFKNIIKKPIIWLPTIIASAILGPIATCVLKTVCIGSSAGMGTAGLVGIIGTFSSMGNTLEAWLSVLVLELIAPAILVFALDLLMRKLGLIKDGDFKI